MSATDHELREGHYSIETPGHLIEVACWTFNGGPGAETDSDERRYLTPQAALSLGVQLIEAAHRQTEQAVRDTAAGPCDLCKNRRMVRGERGDEHCPRCHPAYAGAWATLPTFTTPEVTALEHDLLARRPR